MARFVEFRESTSGVRFWVQVERIYHAVEDEFTGFIYLRIEGLSVGRYVSKAEFLKQVVLYDPDSTDGDG